MTERENYPIEKNPKDFDWNSVGLDFGNWEEEKIWALELPTEQKDIKDFLWLFDAPFWTNDSGDRWAITPWDVINNKEGSSNQLKQVGESDLSYPIDIFENHGKWLVLDGLHRLVKAYKQGQTYMNVRIITRDKLPDIQSDYPLEMPSVV